MVRLKRRKRERANIRAETRVRCPSHAAWVRNTFFCLLHSNIRGDQCVYGGRTQSAHVRSGTDGGTGIKPSDSWIVPLCENHHREQHAIGEPAFERRYGIDMKAEAARLWRESPARIRYEQRQRART